MRGRGWTGARWARLALVAAMACGGEEAAPAEAPGETAVNTAAAEPTEQATTPATERAEPPAPTVGPELDLLHAVPTEVAASSAYRDRASELGKLFDGDLETAYNSATGSLGGTWFDVRVPAGATVTAIEMTAGYTRIKPGGEDLFTGNHRVRSVRISRDGEELATHDLELDERGLQRIPVTGAAGTYRIELTALEPGSNADWREACVSELRVLGRSADATADARFPLYAVGALPAREAVTPTPREGFDEAHRQFLHTFARQWAEHESTIISTDYIDTGIPFEGEEVTRARRKRAQLLERLHGFVAGIDDAAADRIRGALARSPGTDWTQYEGDLDVIADALRQVASWSNEDPVRCRTAQLLAHVRVKRVLMLLQGENMHDEMGASYDDGVDIGPDVSRLIENMVDLDRAYSGNPGPTTRRLLGKTLPRANLETLTRNWDTMRTGLEAARTACPWGT